MSSVAMGYVNIVQHKVNNRCGKSRWLGEDCVGHVLTLRQYKYYHHYHILLKLYKMKSFLGHTQGGIGQIYVYIPFQFEQ